MNIPEYSDTEYNIIGQLIQNNINVYEAKNRKILGFYDVFERRKVKEFQLPERIVKFSISEDEKIISYIDEANQGWGVYTETWERAMVATKNEKIYVAKMISQDSALRVVQSQDGEHYHI